MANELASVVDGLEHERARIHAETNNLTLVAQAGAFVQLNEVAPIPKREHT